MPIGLLTIFLFICLICRIIIFNKHDISWIKAIIPGVNKYQLGKLGGCKKLICWLNAIIHPLLCIYFFICFCIELWIIQTYSTEATIPYDTNIDSKIYVAVPKNIANIAIWSKYILIAIAIIALISWCIMMWKFTITHKKNTWWILLWAIIPVIPYCYFAASKDVIINGKRYTMKRVEISDE